MEKRKNYNGNIEVYKRGVLSMKKEGTETNKNIRKRENERDIKKENYRKRRQKTKIME